MKKATVINALNELPGEFKLDELLERLIVLEKTDAGMKEAKSGKTIEHDRVKKWWLNGQNNLDEMVCEGPACYLGLYFFRLTLVCNQVR